MGYQCIGPHKFLPFDPEVSCIRRDCRQIPITKRTILIQETIDFDAPYCEHLLCLHYILKYPDSCALTADTSIIVCTLIRVRSLALDRSVLTASAATI